MFRGTIFILLLLLAGCGAPLSDEQILQRSQRQLELGEYAEALKLAREGLDRWSSTADEIWHWRFRLLIVEILFQERKPEQAWETLTAVPLPAGPEFDELRAEWLIDRARFFLRNPTSEHLHRAMNDLEAAYRLASRLDSHRLMGRVEFRKAQLLLRQGNAGLAEEGYRQAYQHAEKADDPSLQTIVLGSFGYFLMKNTRCEEALPRFELAIEIARRHDLTTLISHNAGNLGVCYSQLGDSPNAVKSLSQALELAPEPGLWQGDMGNAYFRQGDVPRAIEHYQLALSYHEERSTPLEIATWTSNLATCFVELRDFPAAQDHNRRALELDPGMPYALINKAEILQGLDRAEEAEQIYRSLIETGIGADNDPVPLWSAQAGLARLFGQRDRPSDAEYWYRAALGTIERAGGILKDNPSKITFQQRANRFLDDYVALLMGRGKVDQAIEAAELWRARVLTDQWGPEKRQLAARADRFRELSDRLGALLFSYWLAPGRSFLWVVDGTRIHSFSLPGEEEVNRLVRAYGYSVNQTCRDTAANANPDGERLFAELVAPAAELLGNQSRVLLVPDGSLNELNFETLIVPGQGRYWIEDAVLATAPSLALLATSEEGGPGQEDGLLLIADPQYPDRTFPRLAAIEREIRAVSRHFPSPAVVRGSQATPKAYRLSEPGRYSVIHFATHAVADPLSPLRSAIILSGPAEDYRLYAGQIHSIPIDAGIVTISACQGAGNPFAGEGLVGLAWAFLRAGARNVVAGLWRLEDEATAELMEVFYDQLMTNRLNPAESLRRAKLALLRSDRFAPPCYWGAFQVISRERPFSTSLGEASLPPRSGGGRD